MHAGEPHLFEHLAVGVRALVPNGRLEWLSAFINGQRLKSVIHPATQPHIVKTPTLVNKLQQSSNRNTQRANRVKDPDKGHRRLPACAQIQALRDRYFESGRKCSVPYTRRD